MKTKPACTDPLAALHAKYFQTSIQSAVDALNCALDNLEQTRDAKQVSHRKLHAEDTKNHIDSARQFLVNLAAIHGIEPEWDYNSTESEYFTV